MHSCSAVLFSEVKHCGFFCGLVGVFLVFIYLFIGSLGKRHEAVSSLGPKLPCLM